MKKRPDYTGKVVFIGVDVHKKTYSVVAVCDGELVKRDSMTAKPEILVRYLKKYFQGAKIKSAYEAGFCGFYLHRYLLENNIDNIIVHAAAIEISARDRVKTDKRDASKIAVQLSVGRLRGIHIPTPEVEDRRELTRLRNNLVKDRNRTSIRLKHKANYYGLIGPKDTQRVSLKWIDQLLKKKVSLGLHYHLETLVQQWKMLSKKIKEVDTLLVEQAVADDKHEVVYRSAKGVGPTAARVLANELGDMSHFLSEGSLFSYTGLTPSEFSSGERRRQGHISRQGKPILRSILVQCSWIAIRYDKSLRGIYERLASRAGKKRAIVAIARRLIGRLRSCFKQGVLYNAEFIQLNQRQAA